MEHEFWHQRWRTNQIGFHLDDVNPLLVQFFSRLPRSTGGQIFVPLCGKSVDMIWLREQGYKVVGVELSELALTTFFEENIIPYERDREAGFTVYRADGITLYAGDFFALSPDKISGCSAVYDRAALVAFPEAKRSRYAQNLCRILAPSASIFLITLQYPQNEMVGPPFSVTRDEVTQLYGDRFSIQVLYEEEVLDSFARFKERGLTALNETVLLLTPKVNR